MRCRQIVAVAVLFLAIPLGAQEDASEPSVPQTLEELEARIREILEENNTPGAGVALVRRDEVLWTAGIGLADRESGRPATADTLFRLGSISKTFTSLSVLRLVEDGVLDLGTPVRELIPEVEFENPWEATEPVRLVHLLEHTAGFDDIHLPEYAHNQDDPPVTTTEGLAFHPHSRHSRWSPGRYMSYCNAGPAMAGAVVEAVSGERFEDFAGENVLAPLGMATATYFEPRGDALATGYEEDGTTPGLYWHIAQRPSGALNASPREMASLLRMFLGRGTLDGAVLWQPSSIERMETPTTPLTARHGLVTGYGLSNYTSQRHGFLWHGHGGGVNTFITDYAYNLDHGVGFFVAINAPHGQTLRELRNVLRDYLVQGLDPEPEPTVTVSVDELSEVAGYYRGFTPRQALLGFAEEIAVQRVTAGDGVLEVAPFFGGETERLMPLGERRFRGEEEELASAVFVPGSEDGDLLLGTGGAINGNFRRVSAVAMWTQVVSVGLSLVLLLSAVLFAVVWLPRLVWRRLRGKPSPWSPESLAVRVWPVSAIVVMVGSLALFAFGINDPFTHLAAPTFWSVGFTAGTLLFALLVLVSVVQVVRARGGDVHRGVYVHGFSTTLALVVVAVQLGLWGILGMRTWV